jgi:hypothetical protein
VAKAAESLRDKVLDVEKTLLVPDLRQGWADNINAGIRLLEKLTALAPAVQLGDYRPTDAAEAAYADFAARIDTQLETFDSLLSTGLADFNALTAKHGLPAIVTL